MKVAVLIKLHFGSYMMLNCFTVKMKDWKKSILGNTDHRRDRRLTHLPKGYLQLRITVVRATENSGDFRDTSSRRGCVLWPSPYWNPQSRMIIREKTRMEERSCSSKLKRDFWRGKPQIWELFDVIGWSEH